MAFRLPSEAFVALAAVSWADKSLRMAEQEGLLRAARAAGLEGEDLFPVEVAMASEPDLADFSPEGLSPWQRVVLYALGCWLARLDGVTSTEEHELLRALAAKLELDPPVVQRASAASFDVYCLPEGGRPEKFDFAALEARLREKLPSLAKDA